MEEAIADKEETSAEVGPMKEELDETKELRRNFVENEVSELMVRVCMQP